MTLLKEQLKQEQIDKKTMGKKRLSKTKKYTKTSEEAGLKPKYSTVTYFNKTYKKEQYERDKARNY